MICMEALTPYDESLWTIGITSHFIDLNDTAQLEKLINRVRVYWIETPTNPIQHVDIRKVTKIAEKYGILDCVDHICFTLSSETSDMELTSCCIPVQNIWEGIAMRVGSDGL